MELKDRERPRASQRPAIRALAWVPACAVVLSLFSAAPTQAAPTQTTPAGSASSSTAPVAKPSSFASQLESKSVDPDRVYSTDVRWWLGEASHTDETLLEEIRKLYDGGYRGVELAMQGDNAAPDATYGYGSPMWSHKWNLMMNKLLDLGMGVYLTSGTNWATSNVPDLDPDSQAAMQNLTLGTSAVAAGQSISVLPTPAASVQKAAAKFVTAYAYKIVEGDTLDPNSFIDLSSQVSQGASSWTQNISWTAPSDASYRVFAMWTQGTYQDSSPSVDKSYTTNYFDTRGVDALKEFWQDHYLSDPALNEKIKKGDVQLFMDSLEIHPGGGSEWTARVATAPQFTFWAEDMKQQFQQRKGYDITPWLFLVKGVQSSSFDAYFDLDDTGNYRLAGANDKREDIVNDYLDVLTQLYQERMLQPLKEWMNSVGIKTRAQISYGKTLEISEPIMNVDYPEAENYNQYNQIDLFRLWTGGSKLQNKVLSSETGAEMPVYSATRQDDLEDAYIQYAAGMQRIVWHVWGAGFSYGSTQWPGHNPTSFRQLGSRQPTSADYDEFNAHLGRVQQLVQTGKARSDVGFLRQNWNNGMSKNAGIGNDNGVMNWTLAHQGISYRSTELQDHGYTYDYFSPDFLFADGVSFDENTKTIEKGGYKAVVLYQNWLDLDGAKRVLDWAKKGLRVVILGDAASRTPFNDGKDAELKSVIDELTSLPTVRTATVADSPADYFSKAPGGYDDDVMEKLQELGVQPYTGFSEENLQLLNQTRVDDQGNQYVYLYNFDDGSYHKNSLKESVRNSNTGKVAQTEIVKEGTFVPYRIDAWTGKVTEIAEYEWKDGKTVVPVSLDYNNVDLLAFEKTDGSRLHATATDAASARSVDGGVAVRATKSGTVTTELSNGKTRRTDVSVPASYDIRNWNLTVSSWKPGATPGDLVRTETVEGVTTTNKLTSTQKTDITVGLDTLKTWDQIPEVGKNVSGTGRYEAKFSWDAASASGAYLDLGSLVESATVWINGKKVGGDVSANPTKARKDVGGVGKATIDDGRGNQVPLVGKPLYSGGISWTKPVADVSAYLVNGENSILIEYASSLSNLQLSRGIGAVTPHYKNWWNLAVDYFPAGPRQAKIVPFQDVVYDASMLDVTVGASVKALGGKAYVVVSVTNTDAAPVDVEVSSIYGGKSFVQVAPGKTVSVSLNTRASAIPAGEVTVAAKGTVNGALVNEQKKATFGAFSAGR